MDDERTKTFRRWKWAEEHAKSLIDRGRVIVLAMHPDVRREDGGETFRFDEFVVVDLGERQKSHG